MERPTTDATTAPPDRTAAGHPSFLPSDVDPTVFDEDFLRRLERLSVLVRRPVRGGLKGGRRSVKRGQSVEFADYRDYALGDDLRQLDWNVYARLEKLLVKLFIEEEDLTVALPALRHRIILNFEGEAEGVTADAIVGTILDSVAPPAVE